MIYKGESELERYLRSPLVEPVQTLSIVTGTMVCNAKCPDCVSEMTTDPEIRDAFYFRDVDWDHFDLALKTGLKGGIRAVLFTGKGEPTLYPEQLLEYLVNISARIPDGYRLNKEMQTNGLILQDPRFYEQGWLEKWKDAGLDLISISVVDVDDEINHQFYNPHMPAYPSLDKTIDLLHQAGYPVRLSVTMMRERVDGPDDVDRVMEYAKEHGIEQVSMRPVRKPEGETYCPRTAQFVYENELLPEEEKAIVDHVEQNCDRVVERLMHGAVVYEYKGHNLCLTDCLTVDESEDGNRQLIFYSNGMLTDGWTDESHAILGIGEKTRQYLKEIGSEALIRLEELR